MPQLNQSYSRFPIDSFASLDELATWIVFHSKPRQEKALARDLVERNICVFLPLLTVNRVYQNRKRRSEVPLFPGYVFAHCTDENRQTALKTGRVVATLVPENPARLANELQQISRVLESGETVVFERRIEPGRTVRIKSGAFEGLEGKVVSRRGQDHLIVEVSFLQQGASIAIDECLLEQIE